MEIDTVTMMRRKSEIIGKLGAEKALERAQHK